MMSYESFPLSPPASLLVEADPFEHYYNGPILHDVSSAEQRLLIDIDGTSSTDEVPSADDLSFGTDSEYSSAIADEHDNDEEYYSEDGFIEEFEFVRKRVSPVARKSLITAGLQKMQQANNNQQNDHQAPNQGAATTRPRRVVVVVTPPDHLDRERGIEIEQRAERVKKETQRENCKSGLSAVLFLDETQPAGYAQWVCCNCSSLNSGHEWHCTSCKSHKKCQECDLALGWVDGDLELGIYARRNQGERTLDSRGPKNH
ncbi:hypothetical protein QBC43DRAFT_330655 [Cladorrhinum sp. PSN259]|nr:hypothetical protein QBC43DRAFT_330655 [Cladorrhinum sp. PSN259]